MKLETRFSQLAGVRYPIVQGGMSWASSHASLPLAVSRAGALGVIAAGPMYPDALRTTIRAVQDGTDRPFAVNVPLTGKYADAHLDVVAETRVPIVIGSQGGPRQHLARFKDAGVLWVHVVASPEHAVKAEAAGVDALIAVGAEAGGHPGPDEVGSLVLVRAVVRAVAIPVVGAGGVADGAGIAAMLALGAEGAQLGTRFLMTREAHVHEAYKTALGKAGISDTALLDRGARPVRVLKNELSHAVHQAERERRPSDEIRELYARHSLKHAALEGDVAWGKVEAGQCVGLIDDLPTASDLVEHLVHELDQVSQRFVRLGGGNA